MYREQYGEYTTWCLSVKGLSEITINVSIAKMNVDIKCVVLKYCIPGGRVSWMLFCAHNPSRKIFLEFEVHHMASQLLSLHVILLSISTWKKNLLGILVATAAQMEEGSLGFTPSSFKHFVNPCMQPWQAVRLKKRYNYQTSHQIYTDSPISIFSCLVFIW